MAIFDVPTNLFSNTFVFQIFIPFIILFAIFWGLLQSIGKFSTRINVILSFGFALTAAYTNPFILSYIAALGSTAALVLFGLLFLFGVIRWGLSRGHDIYFETSSYARQREHYERELAKVNRELAIPGLPQHRIEFLAKRQKELETKIKAAEAREKAG